MVPPAKKAPRKRAAAKAPSTKKYNTRSRALKETAAADSALPASNNAPITTTNTASHTVSDPTTNLAAKTTIAMPTKENDKQELSNSDNEPDDSKKGFMDLPAELRVEVYKYLFSKTRRPWHVIDGVYHADAAARHCCTFLEGRRETDNNDKRIVCACNGSFTTDILRVSKLVYKEALPIFLESQEVRIILPEEQPTYGDATNGTLTTITRHITPKDRADIKKLVLVSSTGMIKCCINNGERSDQLLATALPEYWPNLIQAFPGVTKVRLHIDPTQSYLVAAFDADAFRGMVEFPNLEVAVVEIPKCENHRHCGHDSKSEDSMAVDLRKKLVATLQEEAKTLNLEVNITEGKDLRSSEHEAGFETDVVDEERHWVGDNIYPG